MKKIICNLILIFVSCLCFVSCISNSTGTTTHTITYYSNGVQVEHTPATYKEGEITYLLPLELEGCTFLGWYEDETYSGSEIKFIDSESTKDYVLYAKWQESIDIDDDLSIAINNMKNYSYIFAYASTDGEDSYYCTYEVCDNNIKSMYEYDEYTAIEYIAYVDGIYYYYGENLDGSFYAIAESEPYFEEYTSYFDLIDFDSLDASMFELKDDTYQLINQNKVNEVVSSLIGESDGEVYTDLQITVENDVITYITIKSIFTYENVDYDYEYEILFDKHGQTSFKLPEVEIMSTTMTTAEVINAIDGESVIVKGIVTGLVGNNFYLEDEVGALYVYLGSTNVEWLCPGMEVVVQGTKDTYKGLVEVTSVSTIEETGIQYELEASELSNTSINVLNQNVCKLVTIHNLTKISGTVDPSKDSSLTFSDGVNTVTVFVSKYLSTETKNNLKSIFDNLNDVITIENAVIGYFNAPQIVITESSKVVQSQTEVTEVGLSTNLSKVVVDLNTSFEEAMSQVTISVKKSNGTSEPIFLADCELVYTYDSSIENTIPVLIKYHEFEVSITIEVKDMSNISLSKIDNGEVLEDIYASYGITRGLPSVGHPKVLVMPIAFTDYPAPNNMTNILEKAFFGTEEDTGWESLQSYYYKSSYGKLTIEGTVLPVFNTGNNASYYETKNRSETDILKEALEYYDSQVNYADYDTDNDGYIDGIYLVYTASIDYVNSDTIWWAFTSEYFTSDYEYYDGVEADFYLFAGYDFLFEDLASGNSITYNMETFIHETGHMLGLDDYYDYDENSGPDGGIGGGDMMDFNVGDHNAFSKVILGWTDAYLMEGTTATITLGSFASTGDCLIIGKDFNGSYFDEYYIIDFYTPDGLNEIEKGYSGLFSTSGIRVYHIDATLNDNEVNSIWDVYSYNNGLTEHKLIELVEADRSNDITSGGYSSNSDLFQVGTSFTWATWYDGTNAGFTITVDSTCATEATITITY